MLRRGLPARIEISRNAYLGVSRATKGLMQGFRAESAKEHLQPIKHCNAALPHSLTPPVTLTRLSICIPPLASSLKAVLARHHCSRVSSRVYLQLATIPTRHSLLVTILFPGGTLPPSLPLAGIGINPRQISPREVKKHPNRLANFSQLSTKSKPRDQRADDNGRC